MEEFKNHLKDAFLTLLILFCLYLLTSCRTTRYIEVPPSVKTEYVNRLRIDTFIQKDSIVLRERGDTVYVEKNRTEYLIRNRIDTIIQRDSIHVAVPVEKIVYKNRISRVDIVLLLSLFVGILALLRKFRL